MESTCWYNAFICSIESTLDSDSLLINVNRIHTATTLWTIDDGENTLGEPTYFIRMQNSTNIAAADVTIVVVVIITFPFQFAQMVIRLRFITIAVVPGYHSESASPCMPNCRYVFIDRKCHYVCHQDIESSQEANIMFDSMSAQMISSVTGSSVRAPRLPRKVSIHSSHKETHHNSITDMKTETERMGQTDWQNITSHKRDSLEFQSNGKPVSSGITNFGFETCDTLLRSAENVGVWCTISIDLFFFCLPSACVCAPVRVKFEIIDK